MRTKYSRLLVASCLIACAAAPAQENPVASSRSEQTEEFRQMVAQLERKVLYHPRKYDDAVIQKFLDKGGTRISYSTGQGKQTAWLIAPAANAAPERLWVLAGGNAALALNYASLCRSLPFRSDAFLLVDYPGYGECAGAPSPKRIRESMRVSILTAAKSLSIPPEKLPEVVRVFGHSIGCSAALLAVEEFHLRGAVLCAPFTSTFELAQVRFGIPSDFPLKQQFDNRPGLAELGRTHGHAWIFHGTEDEIVPVSMSRKLAKEFADVVHLTTLDGVHHNDVISRASKKLVNAMDEARK